MMAQKLRTLVDTADPQIKQLFASLNLADEAHIKKLENWSAG